MTSIVQHPAWERLRKYFKIEVYARDGGAVRPRVRIEMLPMSTIDRVFALAVEMPCVSCGRTIHPIRRRASPPKRGPSKNLYYAPCCPLDVNIGCSRGSAARDEYITVKTMVGMP